MGGALDFGKDGKLYISTGDNDRRKHADPQNLLGKMLRINKDGTIPTGNPFYASATGKQSGHLGSGLTQPLQVRRPAGTGTCSSTTWGIRPGRRSTGARWGANYGWSLCEGNHDNPNRPGSVNCSAAPYTAPVHRVRSRQHRYHGLLDHGGTFYNPTTIAVPEWVRGRLLLRGLLQRLDKDVRSHDRRGERVRNRARDAHRPGGEQGWPTVLPDERQCGVSG